MFWNEPNLYGATFPYKDIPAQPPFGFTPFEQYRRFVPQPFGFLPQPIGYLPQMQNWMPPTYGFVPPYFNLPQFDPTLRHFNPLVQQLPFQQPLYNFYRPWI